MSIYESSVVNVGTRATNVDSDFFEQNMMILFGDRVPESLQEYCYIIKTSALKDTIEKGMHMTLGKDEFEIIYVGKLVQSNLRDLAHVTLVFSPQVGQVLPGQIVLKADAPPILGVGDKVIIDK